MANESTTHVRYTVEYNGRNYEHPLHSNKRYYIRNIADVVNILEYCITQDLKKDLFKPSDKLYNFNIRRLVNDQDAYSIDDVNDLMIMKECLERFAKQIVKDNITRNDSSFSN